MDVNDYYPVVDEFLRIRANESLIVQTLMVTLSLSTDDVKRVLVNYTADRKPVGDDLEIVKAVIRKTQNWSRF